MDSRILSSPQWTSRVALPGISCLSVSDSWVVSGRWCHSYLQPSAGAFSIFKVVSKTDCKMESLRARHCFVQYRQSKKPVLCSMEWYISNNLISTITYSIFHHLFWLCLPSGPSLRWCVSPANRKKKQSNEFMNYSLKPFFTWLVISIIELSLPDFMCN